MRKTESPLPILVSLALAAAGPGLAEGIEITGEVAMGPGGASDPAGAASLRMITELDLRMRLSTTTDNGLTFGLELDLDDLDLREATPDDGFPRRR